jgi:NAD(P)-dependent dehydrogenase (short-subunit alcohol dehydrogenase family)
MGTLEGRVAIITGAGGGVGAAVARLYAAEGAAVVVNDIGASLNGHETLATSPGAELVAEITAAGGEAIVSGANVADHAEARDLVESTIENYGRLDIIANVAGILRDRMIFNMSEEEWDAVIAVHLKGHFNTIRPASAHWRRIGDADAHNRIINYTSRAGLHGAPGQPNYCAAKMGIVGLTYSCAVALKKYGVTTNAISPAASTRMTDTAAKSGVDGAGAEEIAPKNIAYLAAWLGSQESAWCNGHVIHARGYEVSLYSDPAPIATVRADNDVWDLSTFGKLVEESFRPIIDAAPPNPFV